MSTYEIVRLVTYLIGVPIIIWLCVSIARRLRAIQELDAKLKAEEAQSIGDPYAGMARAMEARELLLRASGDQERKEKAGSKLRPRHDRPIKDEQLSSPSDENPASSRSPRPSS